MRIIDKNTDYYDYLQYINPDDTFTFDRSDSYELTKDILCSHIYLHRRGWQDNRRRNTDAYKFMLMQIGSTFWLFLLKITKISEFDVAKDYEIELLRSWKNYDKPRKLVELSIIGFKWYVSRHLTECYGIYFGDYDRDAITKNLDAICVEIDNDNYEYKDITNHIVYIGTNLETKKEKHIPLLKSCGIATIVPPEDIYNAFDEYFSMEKTASEKTEAEGTTNKDKIINHGFDVKTSFRGKS